MTEDIQLDRETLATMQADLQSTLMWCRTFVFGSTVGVGVSYGVQDGWDMVVTMIIAGYLGVVALMIGTINVITYQEHKRELAWREVQ